MMGDRYFQKSFIIIYLLLVSKHLFSTSEPSGFSLKLIPRDSPESPLYPANLTVSEKIQDWIGLSYDRLNYLEEISTQSTTLDLKTIVRSPLIRDTALLIYVVHVQIGNTAMFLVFDTGSGLTWTQCQPCKKCYNQTDAIYDSRASSTYRKLPCSHQYCQIDKRVYQCVNRTCSYNYGYASGPRTKGTLSLENFKFLSINNTFTIIKDIVFGCSNDNENFPFEKRGKIAGIMGLSQEPTSILSQLHGITNRRFSYCFVPFSSTVTAPSLVRFGADITVPRRNVQTTNFVPRSLLKSNLYHLNLIDISVGQDRLGFPSNTFKGNSNGTGGCAIDSGTVLTWLSQKANGINAYARVIGHFQIHFMKFNGKRVKGHSNLELCYAYEPNFRQYLSMTFHFEGAKFVVDPNYVYFFNRKDQYFCVALLPTNGKTILGAYHQQNTRFIYDGNLGALQFVPEDCAEDHL